MTVERGDVEAMLDRLARGFVDGDLDAIRGRGEGDLRYVQISFVDENLRVTGSDDSYG
ncbi:hypothetical protein [Halosolutus halophilus]|uniref:hypothetical protein n=1 Tax=Halosolutus halophilus TaxID=1552990 RepID=UPI0022351B7D|nr:hypothetical protein [Halosolutus halophilus]